MYKHKSTTYGEDVVGEELHADLPQVFVRNSERNALGDSTKDMESFNNIIATKSPIRRDYSSPKSPRNHFNCADAQKTSGHSYINRINKCLGISPGRAHHILASKKDKTCLVRRVYENTKPLKERLQKKLDKKSEDSQKEPRGVTHKSSTATSHILGIVEIPAANSPPAPTKINKDSMFSKVYCDIETTSLHKTCDIIQLAAVCGSKSFNKYIFPSQTISPGASYVTGLTIHGEILYYKGKPVKSDSLQNVLQLFILWLQDIGKCVLIGHNFKSFDFPRIIRSCNKCNLLKSLQETVIGIVDTLPLFRTLYPDLRSYTQLNLVTKLLNVKYDTHNALSDVESLQKLVVKSVSTDSVLIQFSETTESAIKLYKSGIAFEANMSTFQKLSSSKIVSVGIIQKMVKSGLCLAHLKLAISRNGREGLERLFKEKLSNGKQRVTAVKRIIDAVYNFLT